MERLDVHGTTRPPRPPRRRRGRGPPPSPGQTRSPPPSPRTRRRQRHADGAARRSATRETLVSPAPTTAPTPATATTIRSCSPRPPSGLIAMVEEDLDDRAEQNDCPAEDRHDGKQPAVAEHRPQPAPSSARALDAGHGCSRQRQRTARKWQDGGHPRRAPAARSHRRQQPACSRDQQPGQEPARSAPSPSTVPDAAFATASSSSLSATSGASSPCCRADEIMMLLAATAFAIA